MSKLCSRSKCHFIQSVQELHTKCPKLLLRLWKILCVIWRRGRIPEQWRVAEGVWIPKVQENRPVPHHLPVVDWSQDLLQCCLQPAEHLPLKEQVYRHISPDIYPYKVSPNHCFWFHCDIRNKYTVNSFSDFQHSMWNKSRWTSLRCSTFRSLKIHSKVNVKPFNSYMSEIMHICLTKQPYHCNFMPELGAWKHALLPH